MKDINPALQETTRSHVLNYLQLVWFRRRLVLTVTVIMAILGVAWLSQAPPQYVSSSSLRIGMPISDGEAGEQTYSIDAFDEIAGEVEVLTSRKLATIIVTQLQLQLYPELNPEEDMSLSPLSVWRRAANWVRGLGRPASSGAAGISGSPVMSRVIDNFLQRLKVERVGQSRVVKVTFSSQDPELSAKVANALPEAYITARQQTRVEISSSEAELAAGQYLQLQEQLAAAERAETFYRDTLDRADLASIEELEQKISELNSKKLIVISRRDEALRRLRVVEVLLDGEGRYDPESEENYSPEIQRLIEKRARLDEQASSMTTGDLAQTQAGANIAAATAELRAELNQLVIEIQDEAVAASRESTEIESQLAELTIASSAQHRRLMQLRELEKETAINRLRFEAAEERIRQSGPAAILVLPDAELISEATPSASPVYPGRSLSMTYWLVAGLFLGIALVLIRQVRNPGMLSPEHVHFLLRESTIGVIPEVRGNDAPHDLILDDATSEFATAVAALKLTLDLTDLDNPIRSVQLISSTTGEGRAALAVALARMVAGEGQRVLLMSTRLRDSTIEQKMGIEANTPGLTDLILADDGELETYLRQDHRSSLQFLSAGTAEYANPDVVFSSQRMHSLMDQIKEKFDFIVVDTQPVMSAADAIAIGKLVDETLFVVRWNKTPKALVASSLQQMHAGGLDIAGVVLQHVNLQRYGAIEFSDFGYLYHQER